MKTVLLALSLTIAPALAFSATNARSAGSCFEQAGHHADPGQRDRARIQCLKSIAPRLEPLSCAKLTRHFEYSINSEAMKSYCVFDLRRDPKPSECLKVAQSMDYGATRDDLVWGCLRRLNETISRTDCESLARTMVFPYQKARASSYCSNEIRAAQR